MFWLWTYCTTVEHQCLIFFFSKWGWPPFMCNSLWISCSHFVHRRYYWEPLLTKLLRRCVCVCVWERERERERICSLKCQLILLKFFKVFKLLFCPLSQTKTHLTALFSWNSRRHRGKRSSTQVQGFTLLHRLFVCLFSLLVINVSHLLYVLDAGPYRVHPDQRASRRSTS